MRRMAAPGQVRRGKGAGRGGLSRRLGASGSARKTPQIEPEKSGRAASLRADAGGEVGGSSANPPPLPGVFRLPRPDLARHGCAWGCVI